jgi:hypothetical protein
MNASFRERSIWIQLVSTVAILGAYFIIAALMLSNGTTTVRDFLPLFTMAVALMIVVQFVGRAATAVAHRPEGTDERDRLIGWRAGSKSAWVVTAGVIAAVGGLVLPVGNVWVAHVLLLSLFLSEVSKYVLQLVYYRRGI